MSSQEKCKLTWHTYPDHLREMMEGLITSDNFKDVTLVSDDKKTIKAHRNILSSCSPVFKNILQFETHNHHPVIYLRGVHFLEIESILKFIYLGEAEFYEERMEEFLSVAKNLEIKDLGKNANSTDLNIDTKSDQGLEIMDDNVIENILEIEDENSKLQLKTEETASNGSKFQCTQCNIGFTAKSSLQRHTKSVHDGVKYPCNQCDYKAPTQDSLTGHVKHVHVGAKYPCDKCDHQFSYRHSLSNHIKAIHEGAKYPCSQCDYQASRMDSLTDHIKCVHEGVKYTCDKCDYQNKYRSHLVQHKRSVHEGIKYACDQCDKQVLTIGGLKKHIQSEHEDVKYPCNQCNYQFTQQASLKKHMKIHEHMNNEQVKSIND